MDERSYIIEFVPCITQIPLCIIIVFFTDTLALSCSFPYTYDGGLYYSCIDDIENVSPDEDTSACLADNATATLCDSSPGSCRLHWSIFILTLEW